MRVYQAWWNDDTGTVVQLPYEERQEPDGTLIHTLEYNSRYSLLALNAMAGVMTVTSFPIPRAV